MTLTQPDLDERQPPGRPRRSRQAKVLLAPKPRRTLRRVVSAFGFVVAVLVLIVGFFAFRLSQGPVPLPMVTDAVLRGIGTKLPPGLVFSLHDVAIDRFDGALAVSITRPTLARDGGQPFFEAQAVRIGIDALALLRGAIVPTAVDIESPVVALARKADGHLTLRDMPTAESSRAAGLGLVVAGLEAGLDAAGSVNAVAARNMILALDTGAPEGGRSLEPFDILVRRTAAAGGLSVQATGDEGARLAVTTERREGGSRYIEINARSLDPAAMAAAFVPGGPPPRIVASVDGIGTLRLSAEGVIEQGTLSLRSGAGSWAFTSKVDPFQFDEAELRLGYGGEAVIIERAALRAGNGSGSFIGRLTPPSSDADPVWGVALESSRLDLAGPRADGPPLRIDRAQLAGAYDPRTRRLSFDTGRFVGPTASVDLRGALTFGEGSPGIDLSLTGSTMPVSAFKRLWPFFAAAEARQWFAEHIDGGTVENPRINLAIPVGALVEVDGVTPPLPPDAIDGSMAFDGASISLLDTFPPMNDAKATARVTGREFEVNLESAQIVAADNVMTVTNGRYYIANMGPKKPDTQTTFRLEGPAAGLAAMMRMEPLAEATKTLVFDPAKVTGTVALDVGLAMPLGDDPTPDSVSYSVSGSIEGMTIDGFEGNRLEDATLAVELAPGLVDVSGEGRFSGAPASIAYRREGDALPAVRLSVTLDDKARAKKGLDLGSALTGPIRVNADLSDGSAANGLAIEIDLTDARISDLVPGWQKNPGRQARATLTWVPADGGGGEVRDLVLEAGQVAIRGEAKIDADGSISRAKLPVFRIQPTDDVEVEASATAQGRSITLRGKSIDVRGALTSLLRGGSGSGGALSLSINVDRAIGFNDAVLSELRLNFATSDGVIQKLAATGQFGPAPASADLGVGELGERVVQIGSTDAGAFLRFFNYYAKVRGGRLDARITPDLKNARGVVFMRDFVVRGDPAIGQFFSNARAVPTDGNAGGQVLPPAGQRDARFSKLRLAFSRTPQRLTIDEGVIWGPEVGASVAGFIDYSEDRVNITGTFVPAYALNNIFAKIPVLGLFLGGGQYGGLFAITFRVAGPVVAPTLTVNPLSGIAPGILRKLFEFQKE